MKLFFNMFLPIIRLLPPWWRWRLYRKFSGDNLVSHINSNHPVRSIAIRPHGYRLKLDSSDWMERYAMRMYDYYDYNGVAILQVLLKKNDTFIDIGANIGFMALTAFRCVGPNGKVICFEPNPLLVRRLRDTKVENNLRSLEVLNYALGATQASVELTSCAHHGQSHIFRTDTISESPTSKITVEMDRADSLLLPRIGIPNRLIVKIDVEGFETNVLNGFGPLLGIPDMAILIEMSNEMLHRYGNSSSELFDFLEDSGFLGFLVRLRPWGGLTVSRLTRDLGISQYDAVFVKGELAQKLKGLSTVM